MHKTIRTMLLLIVSGMGAPACTTVLGDFDFDETCADSVKNGAETDVDCGGGTCPACGAGTAGTAGGVGTPCTDVSDCSTGACTGNVCSLLNGCDLATVTDMTSMTTVTVTFASGSLTYAPKCLKLKSGTVVTFKGSFDAHPLQGGTVVGSTVTPVVTGPFGTVTATGSTATFTMSSGTFPYYCTAHALAGMTGAIFVAP